MRKSKTVYSYNPVTKKYIGIEKAEETWDLFDPPVWLMPANTTDTKPPEYDSNIYDALFNEKESNWNLQEIPTPLNTPQPEFDPILFKIQWNEEEKKWDLKKIPPTPENTPKPDYDQEIYSIEWDYVQEEWKKIELPTPENSQKPEFGELYTQENYEIVWNTEKRFWEFKRKINWNFIRELRSSKLRQSDWSMLPDANPKPSKEAWLEYRQALRDIPQKFSNPEDVIWPLPPG
jgi:hypothetical protein